MFLAPIPTTMFVMPTATPTATPVPVITPILMPISPVIQLLQTHSPIIMGFDVRTLGGTFGLTVVESFVKYLQNQWGLPTKGFLPVLVTMLAGIGLNLLLAWYLHLDYGSALASGAFTGVLASTYHEATKERSVKE